MKNTVLKLIMLICALAMFFTLIGCDALMYPPDDDKVDDSDKNDDENKDADGENGDGEDDGKNPDGPQLDPDKFQLVLDGVCQFNFVITSEVGSTSVRKLDELVGYLRERNVEVNDVVRESKASDMTDYEIIVGTGAKVRGGSCNVSDKYLGLDGYLIQSVGTRIVIAGGTPSKTAEALDMFIEDYLGIDMTAEEPITLLEFDKIIDKVVLTQYDIDSIKIGDVDLSQYVMSVDMGSSDEEISPDEIRERIYNETGYWIDIVSSYNVDAYRNKFLLKYVDYAGEDGFRVYVSNGQLIVECAYINCMMDALFEFMEKYVFDLKGDIVIPSDLNYTKHVSTVKYSDFGAVGDGVTDDYQALYDAHEFANAGGQKVYADEGKTYYLNYLPTPILVKTDVDFGEAKFIIDDRGSEVYNHSRNFGIFHIVRDQIRPTTISERTLLDIADDCDITITTTTISIPWISQFLGGKESMLRIYNNNHRDFVRYGGNQNSGNVRTDVVIVSANGRISSDTPVAYDFEEISSIAIYPLDDKPITINGGNFETIACRTVVETDYINKWSGYRRGIYVERANVTITNVDHTVTGEPAFGEYPDECKNPNSEFYYNPEEDFVTKKDGTVVNVREAYGSRRESYPYNSFLFFTNACRVTVKDTTVQGHTTYYEPKPVYENGGSNVDGDVNYVPMGTYDYVMEYSIGIKFDNVRQTNSITDQTYWGIMSSNGSKNLEFVNCYTSRFDAHRGFWNATLTNVTIGQYFNVIGGGVLNATKVTVLTGNMFIRLRNDYGATFRGDINLKDCTHEARDTHIGGTLPSNRFGKTYVIHAAYSTVTNYLNWDFGYTCYMPQNVTLDNFKSEGTGTTYLFTDVGNAAFESEKNPYIITKTITYKNMSKLTTCPSSSCTKLRAVPVTVK